MKKILAIGNSFSQDAMHYLPALCELSGVEARICALYIGGCRLSLFAVCPRPPYRLPGCLQTPAGFGNAFFPGQRQPLH